MRGIPSLITEIQKVLYRGRPDGILRRLHRYGGYPFKIVPARARCTASLCFSSAPSPANACGFASGFVPPARADAHASDRGHGPGRHRRAVLRAPLVNIIACHACPTRQYRVNELCQAASPPRASACARRARSNSSTARAASTRSSASCGKCARSCPYNAITYLERPCQAACGMDAIGVDEYGKACIDLTAASPAASAL